MADPLTNSIAEVRTLPSGTVTLMFTDIEGSTELLRGLRGAYGALLADHAAIIRAASHERRGIEVDTQGDSFFFAFSRVADAVLASVSIQRQFAEHRWPSGVQVRVRIGVHTGEPDQTDGRYIGLDVHRAARICSAAHGGQVLLSETSAPLMASGVPGGVGLRRLQPVVLKGFEQPEQLTQLVIANLTSEFPTLRTSVGEHIALEPLTDMEASADSPSDFEISLLGPVSVYRNSEPIRIGAAKHRMIIATLALRLGEVVSQEALIEVLWGLQSPETAQKALQVYVSELRKLIEDDPSHPRRLTTHPPGYRLSLPPSAVDLRRFEQLWESGREALAAQDGAVARRLLTEALALWRGEPLSDFAFTDAFAADIHRLNELRVACLEDRIDADLVCGDHALLVAELEGLVEQFPLRERLCSQLILALYRSGRQVDALAACRAARETLLEEFGIDPGPGMAALERQILQHDARLQATTPAHSGADGSRTKSLRTLVVVSQSDGDLDPLCALGEKITSSGDDRELVITRLLAPVTGSAASEQVRRVTAALVERRDQLQNRGATVRVAAFSSRSPSVDLVKLCKHQDADMLLIDGAPALLGGRFGVIDQLFKDATCDVALHLARAEPSGHARIVVPFSGSDHDWAALELGVLLARGSTASLALLGVEDADDHRDASRLLATASLIIQRISSVVAEPVLLPPGSAGILRIAGDSHVITGLSPRFREEGLGEMRFELANESAGSVTFVRRGARPGVLAPPHTITRYTWSLTAR